MRETATEIGERLHRDAVEAYHRDQRFRSIVQQIVAYALNKHGPVDPERADREAHDIAQDVCAMLLRAIYEEDAELRAVGAERDRFRKIAEDALGLMPPRLFIPKPAAHDTTG